MWLLYGEFCEYKKYYDYYGVNFVNKRNITITMGWALWIKEILQLLWGELCDYNKYYDYYGVSFVTKRNITILIIIWWALWI